jgi:hypothetical protein
MLRLTSLKSSLRSLRRLLFVINTKIVATFCWFHDALEIVINSTENLNISVGTATG